MLGLAAVVALSVAGCGFGGTSAGVPAAGPAAAADGAKLVGKWNSSPGSPLEFRADGTVLTEGSSDVSTWKLSGDLLTMSQEGGGTVDYKLTWSSDDKVTAKFTEANVTFTLTRKTGGSGK